MNTESKDAKPKIGFIGMGGMGSRMALRLLNAHYPLTVYNRTKEKTKPLTQQGAAVADTPRELAANCQVVISCVTNDAALEAAMLEQEGAIAGAKAGTIFIDMSTVSPETSRRIFEAAKAQDMKMIDAAVSGSTPQVEEGTLVILVGGEQETYQQCKPILDVLGKESFYMGDSGMGTTMKLVVNALMGLGLQAVAEALALGEKAGLQKDKLLDVLGQTAVISPAHKLKLENAQKGEYPANFPLELMYKDFELILSHAAKLSVPMPATAVAQQICAIERSKATQEDYSVIIKLMQELAGLFSS